MGVSATISSPMIYPWALIDDTGFIHSGTDAGTVILAFA
jgi:hypothetical protein